MAYLFYKVLEFLSNASQCTPTKKVVDLIISATAMIRPHQKNCVSSQPTGCNFSQTGNFCGPIIPCVVRPIHPSRSGMYTLCMTVQNSTLEPQLLLWRYCYHALWRLNLSSWLQASACPLAPRAGVALSGHVRQNWTCADISSGQSVNLIANPETLGHWTPSSLKTLKIIALKTTTCNTTSLSQAFQNLIEQLSVKLWTFNAHLVHGCLQLYSSSDSFWDLLNYCMLMVDVSCTYMCTIIWLKYIYIYIYIYIYVCMYVYWTDSHAPDSQTNRTNGTDWDRTHVRVPCSQTSSLSFCNFASMARVPSSSHQTSSTARDELDALLGWSRRLSSFQRPGCLEEILILYCRQLCLPFTSEVRWNKPIHVLIEFYHVRHTGMLASVPRRFRFRGVYIWEWAERRERNVLRHWLRK